MHLCTTSLTCATRVPAEVTTESNAYLFNATALLHGLANDLHADRGEVGGIRTGAKEKYFRFGCVEFGSVGNWAWNHDAREDKVDYMLRIRLGRLCLVSDVRICVSSAYWVTSAFGACRHRN